MPITFYPIKNFPDYSISKDGLVISWITKRILKEHISASGYKAVSIKGNGRNIQHVHRLLAETFIPNPENLPEVNHIDGNKLNNSLDNLEWISGCNNIRHAFTHNLCVSEAACDYEALDYYIQRLLTEPKLTWSSLAREMDISDPSTLRKLIKRDLYRRNREDLWEKLTNEINKKGHEVTSNKVVIVDPQGRENIFTSQAEAAKWLGVSCANVCRSIKINKPCAGCFIKKIKC